MTISQHPLQPGVVTEMYAEILGEIWEEALYKKDVGSTSILILSSTAGLEHRHDGWSSGSHFRPLADLEDVSQFSDRKTENQKLRCLKTPWDYHNSPP